MSKFKSFEIDGRLFQVSFTTQEAERLTATGDFEPVVETYCRISHMEGPARIAGIGLAICSQSDPYDRTEGYRLAFNRAVAEAEDRTLGWEAEDTAMLARHLAAAAWGRLMNDDLWADWDNTLAEVDKTFEIIDWHRADARRLGIEPSTPDGTVMSMYDYHRVFQALKGRQP